MCLGYHELSFILTAVRQVMNFNVYAGAGTILLGRSLTDLQEFAETHGQPKFRGKQLYDGLMHGAQNVLDINNVSVLSVAEALMLQASDALWRLLFPGR